MPRGVCLPLAWTFRQNLRDLSFSEINLSTVKRRKGHAETLQSLVHLIQPDTLPSLRSVTSLSFEEVPSSHWEDLLKVSRMNKIVLDGSEDHWCVAFLFSLASLEFQQGACSSGPGVLS